MKLDINSNVNFDGQVNRGILGPQQERVFNTVRSTLSDIMKDSKYDLFVAQERKYPNSYFNQHVKFSLWTPNSRHKLPNDYVEVYEHKPESWIKKLKELMAKQS